MFELCSILYVILQHFGTFVCFLMVHTVRAQPPHCDMAKACLRPENR